MVADFAAILESVDESKAMVARVSAHTVSHSSHRDLIVAGERIPMTIVWKASSC